MPAKKKKPAVGQCTCHTDQDMDAAEQADAKVGDELEQRLEKLVATLETFADETFRLRNELFAYRRRVETRDRRRIERSAPSQRRGT